MKLIQTSTELFPILNPDLYESAISPSVVFDWEQQQLAEELPESIKPYDMGIDLKKYLDDISEYNDNPGSIGEGTVLSNGINPYTTGPKLIVRMQLPPNAPFKIGDKVEGRYKLIRHQEEQ